MENIEMIKTNSIYPHPDNPRKDLGDLTELAESIRQNGIYQNLTVVLRTEPIKTSEDAHMAEADMQAEESEHIQKIKMRLLDKGYRAAGGYTVVIGHRRLAAAKLAGLEEVPCVVVEMELRKQVETMLLENMQRADLTLMEQVYGFQQLLNFGDSIKDIALKTGFSERTVRRRTEIARLDPGALEKVMKRHGQQLTLEEFDMLAKIEDIDERNRLLNDIGTNAFNYKVAEAEARQNNNKARPEVEAWLTEHNIKKIKNKEYIWRDYDKADNFGWNGLPLRDFSKKKNSLNDLLGGEQLFYDISNLGNLSLYHKHAEKQKKEEPKKTAKEIAEEKQKNSAWEYLIEQSRLTYELRKDFIENYKVTKKNIAAVMEGALLAGIVISYCSLDITSEELHGLLGINADDAYKMPDDEIALKAIKNINNPEVVEKLPVIIYKMFDDGPGMICDGDVWRGTWPEYEPEVQIIALYQWLEKLGYKISEEERGLIQGTDINYHLGAAEAEK